MVYIYAQRVQIPLKGEVGGRALNSHGNYIFDHGKFMELCLWISMGILQKEESISA